MADKKKEKIEMIVVGALVFLLLILAVSTCARMKKNRPVGPKPKVYTSLKQEKKTEKPVAAKKMVPLRDVYEKLQESAKGYRLQRDPFMGGVAGSGSAAATVSGMSLSGIIFDEAKPLALINDRIYKVGDKIEPYKIVEIRKDKVILSDDKTVKILTLE